MTEPTLSDSRMGSPVMAQTASPSPRQRSSMILPATASIRLISACTSIESGQVDLYAPANGHIPETETAYRLGRTKAGHGFDLPGAFSQGTFCPFIHELAGAEHDVGEWRISAVVVH